MLINVSCVVVEYQVMERRYAMIVVIACKHFFRKEGGGREIDMINRTKLGVTLT